MIECSWCDSTGVEAGAIDGPPCGMCVGGCLRMAISDLSREISSVAPLIELTQVRRAGLISIECGWCDGVGPLAHAAATLAHEISGVAPLVVLCQLNGWVGGAECDVPFSPGQGYLGEMRSLWKYPQA